MCQLGQKHGHAEAEGVNGHGAIHEQHQGEVGVLEQCEGQEGLFQRCAGAVR